MTDIIIVGGGIIGLLAARELLSAGNSVKLIDSRAPGQEASWAGGGIVSPLYPWNYDDAITDLVNWAQAYYPDLAEELKSETGIDPEFSPCGLYMLDSPEHDLALSWAVRTGANLKAENVCQVYEHNPSLNRGFGKALSMPHVGNIRNPRFLKALLCSLSSHPLFELVANEAVIELLVGRAGISGVKTAKKAHVADKVLIAAGAWTPLLVASTPVTLEIEPVKGEMLVFKPEPGLLSSIILNDGKYLIPRIDGRIVVGSTTEKVGYQKDTTEKGLNALLMAAYKILPALEHCSIEKHWAGLRPGAPAGLPYMGGVPDQEGLYICAGHYRNGLVTAPASARLMADIMLGRRSDINAAPFSLDREKIEAEMF